MKKTLTKIGTGIALLSLGAVPAFAQDTIKISPQQGSQFSQLTGISLPNIITFLITASLIVAAVVFFFMLVWGGIEWITSGGDKAGNENARKKITNALVGLAIVFSAWAIVTLIKVVFGIDLLGGIKIPSLVTGQ